MAERVERLTNLLALLLETPAAAEPGARSPASCAASTPRARSPAAPRSSATRRRSREIGVPIDQEIVPGGEYAGQTRVLDRSRALRAARSRLDAGRGARAAGGDGGDPSGIDVGPGGAVEARRRACSTASAPVAAVLPDLPYLPALREAVARRTSVRFAVPRRRTHASIRGGLLLRDGFWYLIGFDHGARRAAHVSDRSHRGRGRDAGRRRRSSGRPGSTLRTALPDDPKMIGATEAVPLARVRIDAAACPRRGASTSARTVCSTRHPDGAVEVEVPCANLPAFRSWLLGFLEHAEVLDTGRGARRRRRAGSRRCRPMTPRRPPRPAEERLRRLLVMLPWLMERGEVSVSEVAERFDLTEDEVVGDLELAAMCGLPPFVDELIDVFIDEGMIFVGVPRLFTRPLRLNSVEAFELLAAARAAMELPGADPDGALARGLAKLATALGEDDTGRRQGRVDLERRSSPIVWRRRRPSIEQLRIDVHRARPRRDDRVVESSRVRCSPTAASGTSAPTTTARARCARSGLDRIVSVEPTGSVVEPSSTSRCRCRAPGSPTRRCRRADRAAVAGRAVGGRALPGRRRRRARCGWLVDGHACRSPASSGWCARCCGSVPRRSSSSRPSCAGVGAEAADRVLARYRRS